MAETPWLSDAAQAAQKYEEAVVVAVEACAEDTATLDDLRDTASHLGDVATSTSSSRSCS